MAERRRWVSMAYRLPREPSTPRISVWRKLRQTGAAQIVDGLVALPLSPDTRERFDWLAQEIEEAGGEAWVWESTLTTSRQERALVSSMTESVSAEYRQLTAGIRAAARPIDRRSLARYRRELRAIVARDYFGSSERSAAEALVQRIARAAEVSR